MEAWCHAVKRRRPSSSLIVWTLILKSNRNAAHAAGPQLHVVRRDEFGYRFDLEAGSVGNAISCRPELVEL
jgi:hypothetical protein